jgi:hypothetical protein
VIQAIVNAEKVQEALDEYRDLQFPYFQKLQKTQRSSHIKQLMDEVKRGGIVVTPVSQAKKVKSKLKTRVLERMSQEQVEVARRISKKIGGYI